MLILYFEYEATYYLFDNVVVGKRNRIAFYYCVSLFENEVLNALTIRVPSRMAANSGQSSSKNH